MQGLSGLIAAAVGERAGVVKRLKQDDGRRERFGRKRKYSQFVSGAFFDALARKEANVSSPSSQRSEEFEF